MRRIIALALVALSASWFVGCAQDVGDIDRTQPNKLRKSVFEGEWYVRQTVTGVPGTAMSSFVGLEGSVNRVKFEVQERVLVAHRVHEDVLGIDTGTIPEQTSEDPAVSGPVAYDPSWQGAPVAAFPIIGQFDVQRAYNPATGEQQNIIVENYSDRHWTEREWLRVNWGTNIAPMFVEPMVQLSYFSGLDWYEDGDIAASPLYVECRDEQGNYYDCDAENLEADEEVAYIEVTNSYVLAPSWIDCILTFGFPLYGGDCGPETISATISFVKSYPEEVAEYEPRLYTDQEMEWFGYFRTERCAYDRLYGCRDQGRVTLANRHNIWADWKDENGERLPYSERNTRPIVYYLNDDFPIDLLDDALEIGDQYDDVFREVVASTGNGDTSRMFYVCANNMADVEMWRERTDEFRMGTIMKQGENRDATAAVPFRPDDADGNDRTTPAGIIDGLAQGYEDGACVRPDKVKKAGDLRYSYFYWVQNPQQVGPLGYGPSSTDPLTGETITADAYIYGSGIDTYAQYTVDLVDLLNGDLDPVEYGFGENIDGYIKDIHERFGIPTSGSTKTGGIADFERFSKRDRMHQLEELRMDKFQHELDLINTRRMEDPVFFDKLVNLPTHAMHRKVDNYRAIWQRLKDTDIEAMAVTPEIKVGFGAGLIGPDDNTTDKVIEAVGPRRIGIPAHPNGMLPAHEHLRQDSYWTRFERFSKRNMYMADFLDDGIVGLAVDLKEVYGGIEDPVERRLNMFYDIRGIIFKHVMEHEVGHTVGLRHNFEASYDAMSYHPEFWNIRFRGDEEFGYAHNDPNRGMTQYDFSQRAREYQYSSTMDYGPKPTSQSHGIGLYDEAALAYGYGELVHVFKQGSEPRKIESSLTWTGSYWAFNEEGGVSRSSDIITDWDDVDHVTDADSADGEDILDRNMDFWHYSVLPIMFTDDYESSSASTDISAMYDREFVSVEDYNPLEPTRTRVPYRFCSDEYRGGTPYCNVWDDGGDMNEIVDNYIQSYDSYYFHNSYRRGRATFGLWVWPHFARLYGRYFAPIAGMYQFWRIRASVYGTEWITNPWAGENLEVSVQRGLRTLLNVVVAPHPGVYELNEDLNTYEHVTDQEGWRGSKPELNDAGVPNYVELQPGLKAKWRFSDFDYDSGYYFFLRFSILSSFWDRYAAFQALTNPETNFLAVDASSNITAFSIPYYLTYNFELSRMFGGIIVEDYNSFAPVVEIDNVNSSNDEGYADLVRYQDPLASSFEIQRYNSIPKLNPYPADFGNASFNDRYFGMLYSLAFFQVLFDQSFNHSSNIFYEGTGSAFSIPDEVKQNTSYEEFVDPFNHKTYAAIEFSDDIGFGRKVYSPGIQLIRKAQRMRAQWEASGETVDKFDLQNVTQDMDLIIRMNRIFMNSF